MPASLLLGGTRNVGPAIVSALLQAGFRVTVLNRGITPDDLPDSVERLRADRGDAGQLAAALNGREFDLVVDTTLYNGGDARAIARLLAGRVGRYLWLSSGQVYLVRTGLRPPFREEEYPGPTLPDPGEGSRDYDDWLYGAGKRAAEDVLAEARERGFPAVALRLPMIHGERDHYQRLLNYLRRVEDGGPIVAPSGPHLPIRHLDALDLAAAVVRLAGHTSPSPAYNLGESEPRSVEQFIALLGAVCGREVPVVRVERERLEQAGLLPAASPFSGRWMSSLDNGRAVRELGIRFTPMAEYLPRILGYYRRHPELMPAGYGQRPAELALANDAGATGPGAG